MIILSQFNQTAVVQTLSTSQSSTGGVIEVWTNGPVLACFVSDMPETDKLMYGKFDGVIYKIFTFNVDPQVNVSSRIVWNSMGFDVLFQENCGNQNQIWIAKAALYPTQSTAYGLMEMKSINLMNLSSVQLSTLPVGE